MPCTDISSISSGLHWRPLRPRFAFPPRPARDTPDRNPYEGSESPDLYPTVESLERYRAQLLARAEREIRFILRHCGPGPFRVLELGSGSGRLLMALALRGLLEVGVGVEIARSRAAFAHRWAADLGLSSIRSIAADAVDFDPGPFGPFDLVLCVANTFGFFRPAGDEAPAALLTRLRRVLAPNGCILLELYQLSARRRQILALSGQQLRVWRELAPDDPFAFYLSDFAFDPERGLLRHHKVFVGRDGKIDAGRTEVTSYENPETLRGTLAAAGYGEPSAYGSYDDAGFREGVSELLVLLAGTPAWRDRDEPDPRQPQDMEDGPGAWD